MLSLTRSDSVFRKAQEGASSYSFLNTHLKILYFENPGGALSLTHTRSDGVSRQAQEGASSYSFLNTHLKTVYLENRGGALSLIQIVYLEKPRRVLLLILF